MLKESSANYRRLVHSGLSNSTSLDYGSLVEARKSVLLGICKSLKCTQMTGKTRNGKTYTFYKSTGVFVTIDRSLSACPNCGSALLFRPKNRFDKVSL